MSELERVGVWAWAGGEAKSPKHRHAANTAAVNRSVDMIEKEYRRRFVMHRSCLDGTVAQTRSPRWVERGGEGGNRRIGSSDDPGGIGETHALPEVVVTSRRHHP